MCLMHQARPNVRTDPGCRFSQPAAIDCLNRRQIDRHLCQLETNTGSIAPAATQSSELVFKQSIRPKPQGFWALSAFYPEYVCENSSQFQDEISQFNRESLIRPLLSGPISNLALATMEERNGKETYAGRYHRQAACWNQYDLGSDQFFIDLPYKVSAVFMR